MHVNKTFSTGVEVSRWQRYNEGMQVSYQPSLGPGDYDPMRDVDAYRVHAGLRFSGFAEPVAEAISKTLEHTANFLCMKLAKRDAKTKVDASVAAGHVMFEELYARLDSLVPQHVAARVHLTVDRLNISGDYHLRVNVRMAGAVGWERHQDIEVFPTQELVNELLMLA